MTPSLYYVQTFVAGEYQCPVDKMIGKAKEPSAVAARYVAIHLTCALTDISKRAIARFYGRADHSILRVAENYVEKHKAKSGDFARSVEALKGRILAGEPWKPVREADLSSAPQETSLECRPAISCSILPETCREPILVKSKHRLSAWRFSTGTTATDLGDPAPGRSALDRRHSLMRGAKSSEYDVRLCSIYAGVHSSARASVVQISLPRLKCLEADAR